MDGNRIRGRGAGRTTDSEESAEADEAEAEAGAEPDQPDQPGETESTGAANGAAEPAPPADDAGEPAVEPADSEEADAAEPAEPAGPEGTSGSDPEPKADPDPDPSPEPADGATGALTITLPDGSESVSEAILTNRRMLTEPAAHDLAPAADVEELREAVDRLYAEIPEDLAGEMEALEASVDEVADGLDRQQRQIQELTDTVASLAEILGASVEFETLDHDGS